MADRNKLKSPRKPITQQKVSEHLTRLAQPKKNMFASEDQKTIKSFIKKSTLKYKATKRIQNLAKPKNVNPKKTDREHVDFLSQSISSVSPSALSYKPTRRIVELAQPK